MTGPQPDGVSDPVVRASGADQRELNLLKRSGAALRRSAGSILSRRPASSPENRPRSIPLVNAEARRPRPFPTVSVAARSRDRR
jgi:hypothetical protein